MTTQDDSLNLKQPEMRWWSNPMLALQEAQRMLVTGDKNIRPMEDVGMVNPNWENTVLRVHQYIRYRQDYAKLPVDLKAMLEQPIAEIEKDA